MKVGVLENLGINVTGKTLGIIGMGRIGKALAKRANACGMEVLYHNRRQLYVEEETKLNVTYVSKEELLSQSDFVSLNAPYTPETYHIIGEAELKQMKPTAVLINTGRGPLVDEKGFGAGVERRDDSWRRPGCIRIRRLSLVGVAGNGKCRPDSPYRNADIGNAYYHGAYGLQQCNRIPGRRPSCVPGIASMTAEFVLSELQSVGSPEKAAHLSRFFKTGPGQYGEGDRFLGVVVPQTRNIAKANKAMPLDELQRLLDSPWHEARLCALLVLVYRFQDRRRRQMNGKDVSFLFEEYPPLQ